MGAGLNAIIFDGRDDITRVSRSPYNYKSNISKTVRFTDKITKEQ